MSDRAQDTEAIRAALDENVLTIRDDGTRTTAHVAARAALDRLVARLEAAERALEQIRDHADVALAGAAPGETEQTP